MQHDVAPKTAFELLAELLERIEAELAPLRSRYQSLVADPAGIDSGCRTARQERVRSHAPFSAGCVARRACAGWTDLCKRAKARC